MRRCTAMLLAAAVASPGLAQTVAPGGAAQDMARSGAMAGGKRPEVTPDEVELDKRSRRLLGAVDDILKRASDERARAAKLPSGEGYLIPPLWSSTREDRQGSIRALLDGALEVVTDAPIIDMQARLQTHRLSITELRNQIAALRERRLQAPEQGFFPGVFVETQKTIDDGIIEAETRIKGNEAEILRLKGEVKAALAAAGIETSDQQLDVLLDSVVGGDFIRLITAFQSARAIDSRLGELLTASSENVQAARRYFGMHAALFAMLVHAQDMMIERIDTQYLKKLKVISADLKATRVGTALLLEGRNRVDQKRALEANTRAQDIAERAANFYRDFLAAQRKQLVEARDKTLRDLDIADNTYETVEASFQLRALMDDAKTSFEALQHLEAPGFDHLFENEELRREFDSLTQRLAPTS